METTSGRSEVQEALELLRTGRVDEAEAIAMKILGNEPTDPYATLVWGHALVAKGSVDDAIATFENAVKWAPTAPEMRFGLASAIMQRASIESPYFRREMWGRAKAATRAGLDLAPDHPDGVRLLEKIRGWERADEAETVDQTPMEMLGRRRDPARGSQRLRNGPTKEAMVDQLTAIAVVRLIGPFIVLLMLVAFRTITQGFGSLLTVGNIIGTALIVGLTWGGLTTWLAPRLSRRRETIEF